jgi:hypothetical protein
MMQRELCTTQTLSTGLRIGRASGGRLGELGWVTAAQRAFLRSVYICLPSVTFQMLAF